MQCLFFELSSFTNYCIDLEGELRQCADRREVSDIIVVIQNQFS